MSKKSSARKPAAKPAPRPVPKPAAIPAKTAAPPASPPAAAAAAPPEPAAAALPIVARLHGVEVPAAPHLGPGMITSLNENRYERNEIACGLAAIHQGARILELGAGAGVVGAVLARNLAPAALLSVEANPALIPHIAALHAHNGLSDAITLRHGVVLSAPDAPASIDFFVMGNFLGSGLASRKPDRAQTVTVPVIRFDDIRRDFAPDAIMMDIEGGELDLLRHADLSGIRVLVAEFHRDLYGRDGMQECRRLLTAQGLTLDETLSRPGVHVWRR